MFLLHTNQIHESLQGAERQAEELRLLGLIKQDFWEYLETHVYRNWDLDLREFVLSLCIIDQFDEEMARCLTKKGNTAELLRQCREQGNFIRLIQSPGDTNIYALRPEMIGFLQKILAETRSPEQIHALYRSAGDLYDTRGNVLQALQLYEKADEKSEISRLLVENARLHPGVGYYWELRRYYLSLPESEILSDARLIAAMSILQSIMMNDEESERWYQTLVRYASDQKGAEKRTAEERLLYLEIALPQRGVGNIYSIIRKTGKLLFKARQIFPEFSLTNNQPSIMNGSKDFCEWSRKDLQIAAGIGKITEFILGKSGKGLVNLALAESYFEKGISDDEVYRRLGIGRIEAESGGTPEAVFAAVGIFAKLELFRGHLEEGLSMLAGFRKTAEIDAPQLLPSLDTLVLFLQMHSGSANEENWMQTAPDEDVEFCTLERYRYTIKIRVYLKTGRRDRALRLLNMLKVFAEKRERIYLKIEVGVLTAIAEYRGGRTSWKRTLQKAITLAERYHFVRVIADEGAPVLEMLSENTFSWNDEEFRECVYRECTRQAELYPLYLMETAVDAADSIVLSERALQILRMQADGLSDRGIALKLDLSEAGVKYYNRETYKKLGVRTRTAAVTEARKRRLI